MLQPRFLNPVLWRIDQALLTPHCLICQASLRQPEPSQSAMGLLCRACQRLHHSVTLDPNASCLRCAEPLELTEASLASIEQSQIENLAIGAEPSALNLFCGRCQRDPPAFNRARCAVRYEGIATLLVNALKRRRQIGAAHWMAAAIANTLNRDAVIEQQAVDALLPIPLHPKRQRQRQFNQALELAALLGQRYQLPLLDRAACRQRDTASQQALGVIERSRNLRGAFSVDSQQLQGRRIAIIDDVITTTSTARELARCVLQAGASHCEVWAYARTP